MPSRSSAKPSRKRRLDGRTRSVRRTRELERAFAAELGGADKLTGAQRDAIGNAARLAAIAEELQARALAGEAVDLASLARLVNASRRARLDLGIKPSKPADDGGDDLERHLRQRAAERAGASSGDPA
jgi:hypothetical protein